MAGNLSCKVLRIYNPMAPWIALAVSGVYIGMCYHYFTIYKQPFWDTIFEHQSFGYFFIFGFISPIVIPFVLSFTKSRFDFTDEKVIENRGYIFGLFKIPEIRMSWSEFEGWDACVSKFRGSTTRIIDLFPKNQKHIVFSERFARCRHNDADVEWKIFEKQFIKLVVEMGLPKGEFSPPKKSDNFFASVGGVLTFLILGVGVIVILGVVGSMIWILLKILGFFG